MAVNATHSVMPWIAPILRAIPAILVAVVTTFTAGHSARYGLWLLAAWMLLTAASDVFTARALRKGPARTVSGLRAAVGVLIAALAALTASGILGAFTEIELTAMLALSAAAALIIGGILEAGLGVRSKNTDAFSRDWTTLGALQVIAAMVIMLVSPAFELRFGTGEAEGVITGSVMVVGLIGAAAAVIGVLLTIAGLSLRTAERGRAIDTIEDTDHNASGVVEEA